MPNDTTTAGPGVKSRPILFSSPEIKAILSGSKSMTRRVVKDVIPWADEWYHDKVSGRWMPDGPSPSGTGSAAGHWRACPYGAAGDELWVRETAKLQSLSGSGGQDTTVRLEYKARHLPSVWASDHVFSRPDCGPYDFGRWTPSIYMPRWASRITLRIESVRVERLTDISYRDCVAEGIPMVPVYDDGAEPETILAAIRGDYRKLWDSINGGRPGCDWKSNPWLWCLDFSRITPSPEATPDADRR